MNALLKETMGRVKIGDPLFARNLTIFPLVNGGGEACSYYTLSEGIEAGSVTVSELEIPDVNEVILDNQGNEPLFLLDGEEIFGARQTRVTTTAALIEGRSSVPVPVACIEEGRWGGDFNFGGSFSSTHPRLRSIICSGVSASLASAKSFRAPQRLIWNEVSRKLDSLKVTSATSSFHDLATAKADETKRYILDSINIPDAQGMIVTAGSEILGLEYASSSRLFAALSQKLLRGYALDALEKIKSATPPSSKRLNAFLSSISKAQVSVYSGVALGQDYRFNSSRYVGRALVLKDSIVQASFFPIVSGRSLN